MGKPRICVLYSTPSPLLRISLHYLLSLLYFQYSCLSTGFSVHTNLIQSSPIFKTNKSINQLTSQASKQLTNQLTNPNPILVTLELRHPSLFKVKFLRKIILATVSTSSPPFLQFTAFSLGLAAPLKSFPLESLMSSSLLTPDIFYSLHFT